MYEEGRKKRTSVRGELDRIDEVDVETVQLEREHGAPVAHISGDDVALNREHSIGRPSFFG